MLRVSKLTDYATAVMAELASAYDATQPESVLSAQELAEQLHLEIPTVSKLLKQLGHAGLVTSQRGVNGGYRLARRPQTISLADILIALEGPFGMTECSAHSGACERETHCGVRSGWRRISDVIETTLRQVTLADLGKPTLRQRSIPLAVASV